MIMCMSPLELYKNKKTGKWQVNYNPKDCYLDERLFAPCGNCPECKANWRKQLAKKVQLELIQRDKKAMFITLTYNDDNIPTGGTLQHRDVQLFMKRLRRQLEYYGYDKKISAFICGEYGGKNGRAHYHLIVFGITHNELEQFGKSFKWRTTKRKHIQYRNPWLEKCWNMGFVEVGDVCNSSAPYMAKYMCKYAEIKKYEFEETTGLKKPYLVYPKKCMGSDYFLENLDTIMARGYFYDDNNRKFPVPRGYLNILIRDEEENEYYSRLMDAYRMKQFEFIKEQHKMLDALGIPYFERYDYLIQQGKIRREIYNKRKGLLGGVC